MLLEQALRMSGENGKGDGDEESSSAECHPPMFPYFLDKKLNFCFSKNKNKKSCKFFIGSECNKYNRL